MILTAISKKAPTYGMGNFISKDRYEIHKGVKMYFYDRDTIHKEFEKVGLFEIIEINENQPFFLIKCKKIKIPGLFFPLPRILKEGRFEDLTYIYI